MSQTAFFCYNCYDEKPVNLEERELCIPVRGEDIQFRGKVYVCADCGDVVSEPETDNANILLAYREFRRQHGLLQPEEIAAIRNRYGLSQRALARLLGWGQITIQRYERGALQDQTHNHTLITLRDDPSLAKRMIAAPGCKLTDVEKHKLLQVIDSESVTLTKNQSLGSLEEYLTQDAPSEYTGFLAPDLRKLTSMALFYATQIDGHLFKVKLMKLLFFADFLHFRRHGVSISGFPYAAITMGPVPDNFQSVLAWMEQAGIARIDEVPLGTTSGEAIIPITPHEHDEFNEAELDTLVEVVRQLGHLSGSVLRDRSHQEAAWLNTEQRQRISYLWANQLRTVQ